MRRHPQFVIRPSHSRKPTPPPSLLELDMPPAIVSFEAPTVLAPLTGTSAPGASPTPIISYPTSSDPAPSTDPLPPPPSLPEGSYPAQVVIYEPDGPVLYEGTAVTQPDGSIELQVSVPNPPAEGTPVQVILYDPLGNPTTYEGTTGAVGPDGSFPIIL